MTHHAHSASGPFVWGVGTRLALAVVLAGGLWLAVAWALEWL